MIAEKLPLKFDIEKIRDYFNKHVKPLPPIFQGDEFGGWSILSATGDYQDGFQQGHAYFVTDSETGKMKLDKERAFAEIGLRPPLDYVNFTQVGTGYIKEIIEEIRSYKILPHRARWTVVVPHGSTVWHRDGLEEEYAVRLHIPVITTPGCKFITSEGSIHMPADGSCYLVAVNRIHKAVNAGDEERIHIIMDIIDNVGFSEHHTVRQHRQLFNGK